MSQSRLQRGSLTVGVVRIEYGAPASREKDYKRPAARQRGANTGSAEERQSIRNVLSTGALTLLRQSAGAKRHSNANLLEF